MKGIYRNFKKSVTKVVNRTEKLKRNTFTLSNKETASESHEKVTVCLHEMRYQGEFCDLIEHL
jgi:hypothetical protein